MQPSKKKAKEGLLLTTFLECIGEDPSLWTIEREAERPDFVLLSPNGQRVGVELTELLSPEQGKDRAADNRVATVTKRAVSEFLRGLGASGGAIVEGSTNELPDEEPVGLEDLIRKHLGERREAFLMDGGVLGESLRHEWGEILHVERYDRGSDVMLVESEHPQPLRYKSPKAMNEIEAALLATVEKKVGKSLHYLVDLEDRDGVGLRLVIRNPNQRVHEVRVDTLNKVRGINDGRFRRIVVFNMPQDVLDARPPGLRYLDLVR